MMTPLDVHDARCLPTMTKYVEWLNLWNAELNTEPYTLEVFNHSVTEVGYHTWDSPILRGYDQWSTDDEFLMVLEVNDGDDGGEHILICRVDATTREPRSIIQEFDLRWTHVYEDGEFVHTPTKENT